MTIGREAGPPRPKSPGDPRSRMLLLLRGLSFGRDAGRGLGRAVDHRPRRFLTLRSPKRRPAPGSYISPDVASSRRPPKPKTSSPPMPKATTSHVITATASPTSPRRPVPRKPAKRAPAVIRADAVYSWAELRRRLGWAEHAGRQARIAGLRLSHSAGKSIA